MYLNTKQDLVNVDGMVVERDALRIAEAIRAYDPNLVLLCLDPNHVQGVSDAPFVVAEKGPDGNYNPVLRAWVLNDTILERIYLADSQKVDGWGNLVKMEETIQKENQRRYQETRESTMDLVKHIIKDRGSQYSVKDEKTGETVTFFDDRPAERK